MITEKWIQIGRSFRHVGLSEWYITPIDGDVEFNPDGPFSTADEARDAVKHVLADLGWNKDEVSVSVDE